MTCLPMHRADRMRRPSWGWNSADMSAANAKEEALAWFGQFLGMSSALVLNVAGPRESKSPGIQAKAKAFLSEVLWEM